MRISEKGLAMIEKFEGCLLKASNKLDGVWTIGYGQTGRYYGKRVRRGMTTTKAEAHAWLRDHSIKTYEDAVTQAVKVPLTEECSNGVEMMCLPTWRDNRARPLSAKLLDSLAPEV